MFDLENPKFKLNLNFKVNESIEDEEIESISLYSMMTIIDEV